MKMINFHNKISDKALILLSGGLDSAVAAYFFHNSGIELDALTFVNKERGIDCTETKCAKTLARRLGIKHIIMDISCLIGAVEDLPEERLAFKGMSSDSSSLKAKSIPFGVEIMHIIAMMYAGTHGINKIIWAVHLDDFKNEVGLKTAYEYINAIENLSMVRMHKKCKIETPFILMSKGEIVSLGQKFKVPFEDTSSCVVNIDRPEHCGKCEGCLQRIAAFKIAEQYCDKTVLELNKKRR